MYPRVHAKNNPDAIAIIMGSTGETTTYGQLEDRANQGAQLFRSQGLKAGDVIAVWLENDPAYFEICWAAQRAGLYFVPISFYLTAKEASYIIKDSGAQVVITSVNVEGAGKLTNQREDYLDSNIKVYSVGGGLGDQESWQEACTVMPVDRISDELAGEPLLYSSGTTGRPKGIKRELSGEPADSASSHSIALSQLGINQESVVLSAAPIYHATPLISLMAAQALGATTIITDRFRPEQLLAFIERYKVTYASLVPTMFVRLLKLDEAVRNRYDCSSLQCVHHMAAPCPKQVKHDMIDWWGPIFVESYSGSENSGNTFITSEEWLRKPGSVGKASLGVLHICDDEGNELPPGEVGGVYFSGGMEFEYLNDKEKTDEAKNPKNTKWSTFGDLGYVDEDGYLFLTDRKKFMIISGGVNIYPAEAEECLINHPKVADVAVIGVPNADFGEAVKAVVQPMNWKDAGPEMESELITFCRENLSHIKCPKTIDFDPALPRHDNGKLYKQKVKARYWEGKDNA